jgi:hypothetical protein
MHEHSTNVRSQASINTTLMNHLKQHARRTFVNNGGMHPEASARHKNLPVRGSTVCMINIPYGTQLCKRDKQAAYCPKAH